jgi:hypothetical protein
MTLKEQCYDIINSMNDSQLGALMGFFRDVRQLSDEDFEGELDELFCIYLADRHERNNPNFNEADFTPIEDVAAELGIDLGADDED